MASRWEKPVFEEVVAKLDPDAVRGRTIRTLGLDSRIFDGRPEAHSALACSELQGFYQSLCHAASSAGRLPKGAPLVKRWLITGDIYSPKLERFIEVDEYQHFSSVRLTRILKNRNSPWRPLYSLYFWETVLPRLQKKPYHDLDPPHRDEARAYRDELRERLPVLYGLRPTIRIDEFTLQESGLERTANLITTLHEEEL